MPKALDTISRIPRGFVDAFRKINAAIRLLNAINNVEGRGGIKITKSESNWIIEYNPAEVGSDGLSGGGVPSGYTEETFTICEDGSPVDVYLLVKPSE